MRRYKLAVHILVILSVFNVVPVLAAPIPVRELRDACADMVDGGEEVIIVSGKRAEEGEGPWTWYHGLTQASPKAARGSESDFPSTSLQHPPGPPSTSDSESGVHQDSTNPNQLPSSESASRATELPGYSSDDAKLHYVSPGYGEIQLDQSGTTNKISPASSVGTEPDKWGSTTGNGPASSSSGSGDIPLVQPGTTSKSLPASSVRTKTNTWVPTTENEPSSSSSSEGMRRPPYASGGTGLPWHSSDGNKLYYVSPGYGETQLDQSGTTNKISPASSVGTESDKWGSTTGNRPASSPSGGIEQSGYSPDDAKLHSVSPGYGDTPLVQPGTTKKYLPGTSVRTRPSTWEPTAKNEPFESSSSSEGMRRPPYASGGTEQSGYSSDGTKLHYVSPGYDEIQLDPPGTTNKISPASSVGTGSDKWVPTTEIGPATPSSPSGEISSVSSNPNSPGKILPYSQAWEGKYLAAPSPNSPGKILPYSQAWDGKYLAAPAPTPAKRPKLMPMGYHIWRKFKSFMSKAKSYSSNLASKSKDLFSGLVNELVTGLTGGKPKFRPRMSATASGAVNAAQRKLQGTVHTEAITL